MRMILVACVAVALAATVLACSSGQRRPQPAPVATYGPTSQTAPAYTPTYAAAPSPYRYPTQAQPQYQPQPQPRYQPQPQYRPQPQPQPQPYAARGPAGPFVWHTRLADAQAQARREGKLVLVGSTQPGCCLCETFKNEIVPQGGTRVSSVAVGYMMQAKQPEVPQLWNTLKTRVGTGNMMPLVGVFTPDLRYLAGFGGPTDLNELLGALATAQRAHPVSARGVVRTLPFAPRTTAQLNEYGEYEWSPAAELYPRPEDALSPTAGQPEMQALPPAPAATLASVAPLPVAPATATPAPPATAPAPRPRPVAVAPAPRPRPVAVAPAPRPRPVVAAPVAHVPATPKPPVAPAPRPPFSRQPEPATQTWAESALRQAREQIRRGEYGEAKSTLAEIGARMPGTTLAREAMKGTVAIYNVQRMRAAEGGERERLRESAYRNLSTSMWGDLFAS